MIQYYYNPSRQDIPDVIKLYTYSILIFLIASIVMFLLAYPKNESGKKTLLGTKPIFLLQKFLETVYWPVAIGILLLLLSEFVSQP
ncbi:Uncharacterised protein [Streptococcus suis]|uniref:Uncharacterized protein n=1 Tax=Streptococcus suis TaxID=1307 RepID=A0A0Z8WAB6_STRSU|nr:Uncharacterised protein [Streptococcus suis]CYX70776.1 Uncharacterised protein [Streptococcus suis]